MIVHPEIENYLKKISPDIHPVLKEMEAVAEERAFPIVGPLVGRLLYLLIEFGHVHTVLECGSGFGYSALWMAFALPQNGQILCIEEDAENIRQAKKFFERAGMLHKATFQQGDALKIASQLKSHFDMVMNDVHKLQYPNILPHLISRLRVGGILVTDNVLWKGEVTDFETTGKIPRAIQSYNRMLFERSDLFTSIVPLRDGVSLSVKLKTE